MNYVTHDIHKHQANGSQNKQSSNTKQSYISKQKYTTKSKKIKWFFIPGEIPQIPVLHLH